MSSMITKVALMAALTFTLGVGSATAQALNRPTVGLSYSFLRLLDDADFNMPAGWLVSFASPVAGSRVSLVGEAAGNYRSEFDELFQLHTFQGGLRVSDHATKPIVLYGQLLAGVMNVSCCDGDSETYFAIEPGGGVDVRLSRRVSLRLGASYPIAFYEGESAETFRFQAGVVLPLGR